MYISNPVIYGVMRKDKKTSSKFTVTSQKDFDAKVSAFSSTHKGVHVVSCDFGTVFVKTFKFVSQVSSADVDTHKGFWKDGAFHKFSTDFVAKKTKTSSKKRFSVFSGS